MSKVNLKTNEEISKMRRAGRIAGQVLSVLSAFIKPGVSTSEVDSLAENIILKAGAEPSFKNYQGYPATTCISINDEVVHGIPSDRIIAEGDIVSVDVGAYLDGYHSDTAATYAVGQISVKAQKLIDITKKSLKDGLNQIKPGAYLGDVQFAIQKTVEQVGFGIVRDLTGHGIGRELHEAPSIPNFGQKGKGLMLEEGMTLAIEPMVTEGDWHVKTLGNGWTVVTADGKLAAHFEHTIVVTSTGFEILTK